MSTVLYKMEHTCGHLWHRYSIAVNQVIVATVLYKMEHTCGHLW
jgi:hypothetical protein